MRIRGRAKEHALLYIGRLPIAEITSAQILAVARRVEKRGLLETTRGAVQFIGQVMRDAIAKNRNKSRIRARVEHVFAVVKRLWGFTKVRYRGLRKNATRAFTALALANIDLTEDV